MTTVLGIDIGGTGIKGAPVDVETGALVGIRHRLLTPQPSTPPAVARVVGEVAAHFSWSGPVGATFPAVIQHGTVRTAANVDRAWIDTDAQQLFGDVLGGPVTVLNDADAAGLAEMRFGAGREQQGTVIVVTLGTGIGSAVFTDGVLVPNTELGHLKLGELDAEHVAAESVREAEDLSWKQWAARLDQYFELLEGLFWPDLFIVGGGVSKKAEKFLPRLSLRAPIVAATLQNEAGIVGAAMAASERTTTTATTGS